MKSTAIRHILDTATLILRIGLGNISTLATVSAALRQRHLNRKEPE